VLRYNPVRDRRPDIGKKKGVLGEIDIDSNRLTGFNQEDRGILEEAASLLARRIESEDMISHEPSAL